MNESNRKKEAIRAFVPAEEEMKFLGSGLEQGPRASLCWWG